MGKSQKKRAFRRHNPVRVPDSHLPKGLDAAESTSSRKDAVIPIIQKIESSEAQERTWACSAVSNLIQNDPSTRRLLQGKNIVGILIARLSDDVEQVIVEAAGALRNLCIDGGYDICAEMYNKRILEPLKAFVPKIASALNQLVTSPESAPEGSAELVYGLAESVITILWCLSETSNKALNSINQIQLVPFLMGFLEHRYKLPGKVVNAAAQCLYVLSDDNDPVIADLRANSTYHAILLAITRPQSSTPNGNASEMSDLSTERHMAVRLLCTGILKNISPIPLPSTAAGIDIDKNVIMPLVVPALSSVSLVEASTRVEELISSEQEADTTSVPNPSLRHTPKSDHRSSKELELERIEARLRNVQLALEVLTGVCATLPDVDVGGGDEGVDDGDEDDEDEDVDMDVTVDTTGEIDGDADMSSKPANTNSTNPTTATSHLPSILTPLLTLIHPTSLSFPPFQNTNSAAPIPLNHPPTTSALTSIHITALECLNNIFLALAVSVSSEANKNENVAEIVRDVEGGRRVWDAVWSALGAVGVVFGPAAGGASVDGDGVVAGQERRREVWDVAAGVLWGVGTTWKGALMPNEAQVALLMGLCESASDVQVKVMCIGTLECLAQCREAVDANRVISEYLLTIISPINNPAPPSSPSKKSNSKPGSSSSKPQPQLHSPEPLFQATSALIDIFSDETLPYDTNFRTGGYLERLQSSIDIVRRAVRSVDRKKPGPEGRALRARGDEVLENLRAFVKYRRDLRL